MLLSDLEGKGVQAYAMEIESLEKNGGRQHKDMNIRIMDERLLALTGGIVQGMGVIDNMDNTKKPKNTELLAVTLTMNRISVSDQHRHIKMDVALA